LQSTTPQSEANQAIGNTRGGIGGGAGRHWQRSSLLLDSFKDHEIMQDEEVELGLAMQTRE